MNDKKTEKKVRSFNISDKAHEVILKYKNENRMGNNSAALEKMLLDEINKKDKINEEYIRKIIEDTLKHKNLVINETENIEVSANEVVDEVMKNSIEAMKDIFKNMG